MYFIGAKCLSGAAGALRGGGARAALGAALAGGGAGATLALTRAGARAALGASLARAGARAALGAALARAGAALGATLARAGGSLGATLAGGGAGGARATELTAPEGRFLLHLLCWNEGGVWYPEEVMRYVCEIRGRQERSRNNEKYACAAG